MTPAATRSRDVAFGLALLLALLAGPPAPADNRPLPAEPLPPAPAVSPQQPTNKSLVPQRPRIAPLEAGERTFRVPGTVLWQARPERPAEIDREALRRRVLGFFSSDPVERARSAVAIPLPGHGPGYAPIPRRDRSAADRASTTNDEVAAPPAAPPSQPSAAARRAAPPPRWFVQAAILLGVLVLVVGWLALTVRALRRADRA